VHKKKFVQHHRQRDRPALGPTLPHLQAIQTCMYIAGDQYGGQAAS